MSEIKEKFKRTRIEAEKIIRDVKEREMNKFSKDHIYSSISHLETSLENLVDNLDEDTSTCHREHIDNIYYHIGKIKGVL